MTIGISAPAKPASHKSAVSSHIKLAFVDVPLSISIPAFCDGVPVSSELRIKILSPTLTVFELTVVVVPLTVKLPPIVTVVPSSVIVELPTVDAEVNLTKVLFVPDTDTDVPDVPLVPEEPEVPEEPFEPDEPDVPEEPLEPLEPEVPEVAAVYDVPLINNEPVTAILPLTAKLPVMD